MADTIALADVGDGAEPFGAVPASAWATTFDVLSASGAVPDGIDGAGIADEALISDFRSDYYDFDLDAIREEARSYVVS